MMNECKKCHILAIESYILYLCGAWEKLRKIRHEASEHQKKCHPNADYKELFQGAAIGKEA